MEFCFEKGVAMRVSLLVARVRRPESELKSTQRELERIRIPHRAAAT